MDLPTETDLLNLENKIRVLLSELVLPLSKKSVEHDQLLKKLVKRSSKHKSALDSFEEQFNRSIVRMVPLEDFNSRIVELFSESRALENTVSKRLEYFNTTLTNLGHKSEYFKMTLRSIEEAQKHDEEVFGINEKIVRELRDNLTNQMTTVENLLNRTIYENATLLEAISGKTDRLNFQFKELNEKTINNLQVFVKKSKEHRDTLENKVAEVMKDRVSMKEIREINKKVENEVNSLKKLQSNDVKNLFSYIDEGLRTERKSVEVVCEAMVKAKFDKMVEEIRSAMIRIDQREAETKGRDRPSSKARVKGDYERRPENRLIESIKYGPGGNSEEMNKVEQINFKVATESKPNNSLTIRVTETQARIIERKSEVLDNKKIEFQQSMSIVMPRDSKDRPARNQTENLLNFSIVNEGVKVKKPENTNITRKSYLIQSRENSSSKRQRTKIQTEETKKTKNHSNISRASGYNINSKSAKLSVSKQKPDRKYPKIKINEENNSDNYDNESFCSENEEKSLKSSNNSSYSSEESRNEPKKPNKYRESNQLPVVNPHENTLKAFHPSRQPTISHPDPPASPKRSIIEKEIPLDFELSDPSYLISPQLYNENLEDSFSSSSSLQSPALSPKLQSTQEFQRKSSKFSKVPETSEVPQSPKTTSKHDSIMSASNKEPSLISSENLERVDSVHLAPEPPAEPPTLQEATRKTSSIHSKQLPPKSTKPSVDLQKFKAMQDQLLKETSELMKKEIKKVYKALEDSLVTLDETGLLIQERLSKDQEELRINMRILYEENKQLIKQRISDMIKIDGEVKMMNSRLDEDRKDIERLKSDVIEDKNAIEAVVEVQKIVFGLLKQDEEDRDAMNLMVIGENKSKMSKSKLVISLKPECLSCSGQSSSVYSAFKMACLNYSPSEVMYNGQNFVRKNIIRLLGDYVFHIKEYPDYIPSIAQNKQSGVEHSYLRNTSKTPKISARFLLNNSSTKISQELDQSIQRRS